jgi:hypothetical protein
MNQADKPWTDAEFLRAKGMHDSGMNYAEIGIELGRTKKAVQARIQKGRWRDRYGSPFRETGLPQPSAANRAPDDLLTDRNHRSGLAPRDLTAAVFGDPLPGYSALDRRQQ